MMSQLCVCALACPGHPGLRRSRFPVGTTDIPALVNQAPPHHESPVSEKADFGKPNRSLRCWGEPVWRRTGGGWRQWGTDGFLWDVCTLCMREPSFLPRVQLSLQSIKGHHCHRDPLFLSHYQMSIQPVPVPCYHGKAKQLPICKHNHVCPL